MTPSARGIGKTVHSAGSGSLCALLIAAHKAAGLTQHVLAHHLKKPLSFVAKYEGGERRLDVIEFIVVVRAIGGDPVKLLRRLVDVKSSPAN